MNKQAPGEMSSLRLSGYSCLQDTCEMEHGVGGRNFQEVFPLEFYAWEECPTS